MSAIFNLLRRRKKRQHFRKKVHLHSVKDLRIRFGLLALVILAHCVAMVIFERLGWWDAFWLTMTSASTTGYGDLSAATVWGQVATIVLIYGIGITLLAQIASDYIELRIQKKEMGIRGELEWVQMSDHLLIINTPKHYTESYLERLIKQICTTPELVHMPIQFLTPHFPEGLPMNLRSYGVVHQTGDATVGGTLENSGIKVAKYVVILSPDSQDRHSDSIVFDILHRVRELNPHCFVLAEAIDDTNRRRFKSMGANAVIRPVRAYPEILVRALIAPGTEQVLEDLFSHQGDHTIRLEVEVKGLPWAKIVVALIEADIGTALGYEDHLGNVITHPSAQEVIDAKSLLVLVEEGRNYTNLQPIQALFN